VERLGGYDLIVVPAMPILTPIKDPRGLPAG
jgi:hypothetical protein